MHNHLCFRILTLDFYQTDLSYRVRRIEVSSALVTTIAGSGTFGVSNGIGTGVSFLFSIYGGIAVDTGGTMALVVSQYGACLEVACLVHSKPLLCFSGGFDIYHQTHRFEVSRRYNRRGESALCCRRIRNRSHVRGP